jgi:hypothetical protein
MPQKPPVRNAIRIAFRAPPARAAAATPDVAAGGQRHAEVADESEKMAPTTKKIDRPIRTLAPPFVHRQDQQQDEDDQNERAQRLELPIQVRRSAFLDRPGDVLHPGRALSARMTWLKRK